MNLRADDTKGLLSTVSVLSCAQDAYGATELSPVCTMSLESDSFDERVNTVGYPMDHVEVRVVDPESGDTLPVGEPGEVWVRGYVTMLGYWDEPECASFQRY